MSIMEELLAAYGDKAATEKVRCKIEAVAEDFKERAMAEVAAAVKVMDSEDLGHLAEVIERRRAQLRDPAEEARRVAAFRRAAMELAREAADEPLGADIVLFYAVEAECRLTGGPPYTVAVGSPSDEEALEEVARLGRRTHCMRDWLHDNWGTVSDSAETILAVEGIGRA